MNTREVSMARRAVLLILLLPVAVLGLWLYSGYKMRSAFAADKLRPFEELFKEHMSRMKPDATVPPRKGKVLVMVPSKWHTGRNIVPRTKILPQYWSSYKEIDPPRLHDSMFDLDSSIRASDPGEVETVILCQDFAEQMTEKSDTWEDEHFVYWIEYWKGRRRCVLLSVLDVATKRLVGNYVVAGPPPETGGPKDLGGPPDLAEFIETMPRA